MKKIYIAGPDVFEKNSIEIGKKYIEICRAYGYQGLYPLDNIVNFNQDRNKIANDIFQANKKMIDECDIVVANLNSFRGKESDSGTVWECGYAYAKGKKVYGYLNRDGYYIDQFKESELIKIDSDYFDTDGLLIENFDYSVNLMIACSVDKIIVGDFETVLQNLK